jgi:SPP1 family predicted phage head-tail adaptor
MQFTAGELRDKITIERPVVSRDTIGAASTNWLPFASIWAKATPTTSTQFRGPYAIRSEKKVQFLTYWVGGISEEMRLRYRDRIYQITGINELDQHRSIEIYADLVSTEIGALP